MAKIEKQNHRQVAFPKCRAGLFKKVAIIVYSPANKPFWFAARSELSLVLSQVEEEKNKSEAMRKTNEMVKWSVEEMSLLQLQEM
ncbi:hypothetical protein Bca52824_062951 [Brassica carinata]|uniref:MADS-box domain-containing protein n=1 Tax=Brassica carinata TaxID=52824 RepID=A0A8X7U8Q0_BRACI|nr:hypothetical protein Bca52824_062951 [Brassica carinata]